MVADLVRALSDATVVAAAVAAVSGELGLQYLRDGKTIRAKLIA